MSIFEFTDYKAFLKTWMRAQPKHGRGLLRKIADHLRMSSTMMSHVLNGDKHFSPEAAQEITKFLGLSEEEGDYFFLLISYAKAGTFSLRERLKNKIGREQKKSRELTTKVKADRELEEMAKTVFYSNWLYTGVRNMSACPGLQNVDQIAVHTNLPRASIQKVIDFLIKNGLCLMEGEQLRPGPKQTHIGHGSPLVSRHHQNWRLQGFTKMIDPNEKNVFFTSPMSLSMETAEVIRQKIPNFIEEVFKLIKPSPSETVRCLNLDWFEF